MATLLFPISLAIAILRYRLWDIDTLINRTLVYGLVTAMLSAGYFASVVALQAAFRTFAGGESTIAPGGLDAGHRRVVPAGPPKSAAPG